MLGIMFNAQPYYAPMHNRDRTILSILAVLTVVLYDS